MHNPNNMTLREKWEVYALSTIANHDELNTNDVFKWFLAQFDSMLAEDIEAIQTRGLFYTGEILEARRKSLKQ